MEALPYKLEKARAVFFSDVKLRLRPLDLRPRADGLFSLSQFFYPRSEDLRYAAGRFVFREGGSFRLPRVFRDCLLIRMRRGSPRDRREKELSRFRRVFNPSLNPEYSQSAWKKTPMIGRCEADSDSDARLRTELGGPDANTVSASAGNAPSRPA